jgi:lactate dehydrogenase-like 2-hydroxyacid dehydrogenase
MKIVVLTPKSEFTKDHQDKLATLGDVLYTDSRRAYSVDELTKLCYGASILAIDPDNLGGFEKSPEILPKLLDAVPTIKNLPLSTTSYGYIDKQLCQSRGIKVTNVPHYSSESVAEHAITLLLGCSKRIFLSDRRTQKGEYKLEMGYEVAGKALGIIGLGSIGQKMASLALGLGMKVIAYNRTQKSKGGVQLKDLDQVLTESDYLSIHLIDSPETTGIISESKIAKIKKGSMIVNTASRDLIDEVALAKALQSGAVDSYALEAEDLNSGPLGKLENAFLFKGFGWYTKEALERNKEIWVNNIVGLAQSKPVNQVF